MEKVVKLPFIRKPVSILGIVAVLSALLGVVLLIVASFYDLQISKALHNSSSWFARFGAGYAPLPVYLGLTISGVFLILARASLNKWITIAQIVLGVALIAGGSYLVMFQTTHYRSGFPLGMTIAIGLLLVVCVDLLIYKFYSNEDKLVLLRAAFAILLMIAFELALGEIIKTPWSRLRPYAIYELGSDSYFVPWWQAGAGNVFKNSINPDLLEEPAKFADYFKSFPSGHTGHATVMCFLLVILANIKPRLKKWTPLFLAIGVIYAMIMALSRVIIGAHYLSDTMVGFLLSFASGALCYWLLFVWKRFSPKTETI